MTALLHVKNYGVKIEGKVELWRNFLLSFFSLIYSKIRQISESSEIDWAPSFVKESKLFGMSSTIFPEADGEWRMGTDKVI